MEKTFKLKVSDRYGRSSFGSMKNLSKRDVMDFLSLVLDDLYVGGILIQLEEYVKHEM